MKPDSKAVRPIGIQLRGVIPPLVTPLAGPDELDVPALRRVIDHVIAGGVHGLFVLGTTGEGAALSDRLRCELVERACEFAAGRVPVLVGVTDTRVAASVELARFAAAAGATAVVVSTPYYLPLEQRELHAYVIDVVADQPLPVYLYNIPALTKTAFDVDTILRLAEVPKVAGLKDSSGDLHYLRTLIDGLKRKDFSFFVGPEHLLADAVALGAHGCVGGGANLHPRLFRRWYDAAITGHDAEIPALATQVKSLDRIYRLSPGPAAIIRGLKCAMSCLGLCDDRMAEPYRSCSDADRAKVETYLQELGLLPQKAVG